MAHRASILNRGEIVAQGLEEARNPGLTTLANVFLNNFLDQLYAAFDWPWLVKEESITVANGASVISLSGLSLVYRAVKAIHLSGQDYELYQWPDGFTDFRIKIRNAITNSETGEPRYFFPDPLGANDQIYIYPVADQAYTGQIWYYYQPAELTADNNIPVLPDASLAVAAVADFGARYGRDRFERILADNVRIARGLLIKNMRDHGRQTQATIPFDTAAFNWRKID